MRLYCVILTAKNSLKKKYKILTLHCLFYFG